MENLRIYGSDEFGHLIGILLRSGYKCTSWAELDAQNNVIYLIEITPPNGIVSEPQMNHQILNESFENENRSQE